MSRIDNCLTALERRQHFLEQRLKTEGLLYRGRSFDEAEESALRYAIAIIKEKRDNGERQRGDKKAKCQILGGAQGGDKREEEEPTKQE